MTSKTLILCVVFSFITFAYAQIEIVITSPSPFQVFQRSTDTTGAIWISGETTTNAQIVGIWGDNTLMPFYADANGHFEALWPDLPVWQYDLILTIDGTEYTVQNVGIGDVYVIAGQSNAVGAGQHYQMYTNTLGLRAGMFASEGWGELADPTGRVVDSNAKGSLWPVLAGFILDDGIPVAFIPSAVGGTYISVWQPGKPRYQRIVDLLGKLPAPYAKAILWQQGEANKATNPKTYSNNLTTLADGLYNLYSVPLFAALLWDNPNVNEGIEMSIRGSDHIFRGAALNTLKPDGIHYISDDNLFAEAWLWWEALVKAGIYPDHIGN